MKKKYESDATCEDFKFLNEMILNYKNIII